jgi:hypothetical protein
MGRGQFEQDPWGGYAETAQYSGAGVASPGGPYTVDPITNEMVDVTELIDAEGRLSDQRREQGFAAAANRFGQSGMVASTPYMGHLAGVAADEEARKDQIFGTLRYQTGTDFANRKQQAALQQQQLDYQAAQAYEQQRIQAEMANMQRDLGLWEGTNQMNMYNTGLNFQDYQSQQQNQPNWEDQMALYMAGMGLSGGF